MFRCCKVFGAVVIVGMVGGVMHVASAAGSTSGNEPHGAKTRVVLIGASIGQDWNISGLPERQRSLEAYAFEALQVWQFDKTEAVDDVLQRPGRRFRLSLSYFRGLMAPDPVPADIVILKECSSYFPSDIEADRTLFAKWADEVQKSGKQVIVTTVVPVTKKRSEKDLGKMEGIRRFNDWVRRFAAEKGFPVLDLERALRADERERYLRDEYTSGDGSHLNRTAYDVMDRLMVGVLNTMTAPLVRK